MIMFGIINRHTGEMFEGKLKFYKTEAIARSVFTRYGSEHKAPLFGFTIAEFDVGVERVVNSLCESTFNYSLEREAKKIANWRAGPLPDSIHQDQIDTFNAFCDLNFSDLKYV